MQEAVKKINDLLIKSGWKDELHSFLNSYDFLEILNKLKRKVEEDKQRFCPALGQAFKFLEECPLNQIKVIIIVDYISNSLEKANGIPLSLNAYNDNIPFTVFNSIETKNKVCHVKNWLKQGVLVMPLALTTRIEGQAHKKIWQPLIIRILEILNKTQKNTPYVLIGKDCWQYEDDIVSENVRKVNLTVPITDTKWSCWINQILEQQNKQPIIW